MEKNLIEEKKIDMINVSESFISYLDVSELTIESYKQGISAFYDYMKENNIQNPTRIDFKGFREELKANKSINTTNTYLTAVRGLFKYLKANDIYENITDNVKNVKTSGIPTRQVLSKEECKIIYNSLTDLREKAIFSLAITTGLRANEIALAKIDNIKEYNGEIVLFVKCKKREDEKEYVKLSNQVLNDIKNYIGNRNNGYIFVSTSNHNNNNGVTNKTIRLIVKNIFKRFGYDNDGFSVHSIRRSFATISYNEGADIVSIQSVLHQKSVATTRRYIQQTIRDNNKLEYNVSDMILG